ncbi:disease resistance protein RPP13-like [Alnus glutinosa]|uniref:disease resistance protein RPP13-like n=1 Tax=Alnus glutinosa TaxID=3517 RepID=UPI002D7A01C6|nr:disease resistance protein RPP13-like [Alnus glutinosa]
MADSVVTFLLQNLFDLLKEEANFLAGVEDKVNSLHDELSFINIFLESSAEKRKDKIVNEVVRQIRDVAYEAEDTIDHFIYNVAKHRRRSAIRRMFRLPSNTLMLRNVGKKIEGIKEKINEIYNNRERYGIERVEASGNAVEEEAMHRRRREVEEDDVGILSSMPAISIIGMGGLGKTTLARKIYNNPRVVRHFKCRAWVCVSQDFRIRELLLQILKELGILEELGMRLEDMSDDELKKKLVKCLQGRRFLVVMDDIWRAEVWDEVRSVFPDNSNRSRILITSRNKEVALYASHTPPYYLPFLKENESWELFHKKVFRGETCPPELETLGRQIAKGCRGLPLSIVVLAGRLAKMDKSLHIWSKFVGDVTSLLNSNEDTTICQKILSLSYTDLPRHLKPCFLYFGIYPEDFQIPVVELVSLWVAEGFIQPKGNRLPEDDAEMYLEELIDRSLIQVVRRRRIDGGVKTCRIHDLLRDLCISESAEEKFLEIHPGYEHLSTNNSRRLSIQGKTCRYQSSTLHVPKNVRSVFFFGNRSYDDCVIRKWLKENFKLLRVINYVPNSVVLKSIETFIHLRYLRIDCHHLDFPDSICNLTNLVTLRALGDGGSNRYLPKGIFKLQRLRHLYLSYALGWSFPWDSKGVLCNLQVLDCLAINYELKNHRFLVVPENFPNVRHLTMSIYRPSTLEAGHEEDSFPSLHHLAHLETLKIWDCGMLAGYPNLIPSTVTKLRLQRVERLDACVAELGKLPNLRMLKLHGLQYECPNVSIHVIAHSFPQLQFLELRGLRIEEWKNETSAMPRLTHLVIVQCFQFASAPELLSSTTLQYVKVSDSPRLARLLQNLPGKVGFELIID